jgi:cell division protein FtsQ
LVVAFLLAAALLAGYMLWFRDSSLVAIEKVEVTGTDVPSGTAAELTAAATGLSTLHLDRDAVEAAVADDPAVAGLKIDTHFPHGVTTDVESRPPAGWIDSGGVLLAADGTVLDTGVDRPDGLAEIAGDAPSGDRAGGAELAAAKVLGAVPAPLREQVVDARVDQEHGVVAELTGGIELRFGTPSAADQKWRAAAAVLADPKLTSAVYIDLSAPSRPVVG